MRRSILIADDNEHIRKGLRRILEQDGWELCGEATDGAEAVKQAQSLHPKMIVLDLSMPVMDGLQAARILSSLMPQVPLVIFSNFGSDPFLQREALAAGAKQVVSKSELGALVHTLDQLWDEKSQSN